ncbi:MAG TPA: hypothetical protein VHL78_12615 [Actinomycetota bacterium]|nr:hypothetical protein [Actinomycetota bacterium]
MSGGKWLLLGGVIVTISLAAVVAVHAPRAVGLPDRAADLAAEERHLSQLERETDALEEKREEKRELLAEVRDEEAALSKRVKKQERLIESLEDRIEELGG